MKPILFVFYKSQYYVVHKIGRRLMTVLTRLPGKVTPDGYSHIFNNETLTGLKEGFTPPVFYMWHKNLKEWVEFMGVVEDEATFYRFNRPKYPKGYNSSLTSAFLNTSDDPWI